ncbi:putative HTH-type transcriptional regulator YdfH [Gimesia panareensis]|uniref:Putative HTH-type transcriptional regulator YdfH n=1 Tax=Gimesia panareensis TaxID=2527978 RepID=A0A518FXZ3_9PLAN|nr:GntR family transcriptional regulator [Gimesia panareensis]QDV21164.1 putative HTH-type transcriptional regulator YdfH [Gimesia panareensis]
MKTNTAIKPESNVPFRKIQKQSVTEDVESQLRDAILTGVLAPGESLAEARLGAQLGVSRASIRQAKFQLMNEGLLEFDERGTATVRRLTLSDAHEIVEFRQVLELAAIRLACSRLTNDTLIALEENIRQTEQESNLLKLTFLDIAFHEAIMRASGNSRLVDAWRGLRPQLELWLAGVHRRHSDVTARTCEETVASHKLLISALKTGDPDVAEKAMSEHTSSLQNWLLLEAEREQEAEA